MKKTASQRYEDLQQDRDYYLSRGRACARLTIPYLIPSSSEPVADTKESYPVPWNGIGARGVLNLASRMLLALLPPTQAFFRFSLDEAELAAQQVPPEMKTEMETTLSQIERIVLREIEASNDRVVFHEALLHLIVGGNCLLHIAPEGLRCFHLNRYVCQRDPMGNPLEVVICEELAIETLPQKVQDLIKSPEDDDITSGLIDDITQPVPRRGTSDTVRIYTHVKWERNGQDKGNGKVRWYQEVNNKVIPGSEFSRPESVSPFLPLRMQRSDGQQYGISYVEAAALADLQTVEALCQAIAEGSLASSKVLFLVKPSGVTKAANLAAAPNGAFVTGDPSDVLALQCAKSTDLQVAMQGKQQIEARLAQAFMLADVRDSERTTAEEVRLQALQIENSLGSIYSILTTEFQIPYVARKLDILQREKKVPPMDENLVKPVMTVGLAAVGRGNDLEQLVRFTTTLGQTMGPEGLATYLKPSELIKRLAYSMGIDTLGLIKTDEELAQEQQAAQQQAQQQMLMQSKLADPQNVANAVQTAQEVQNPEPEQ
ncbi:MAG: hypothetical protein CMO47_00540 [Verrucomicrobiales bacterium]|nr:hypothetical protein [Verrucomicrobiales bacterium]